MTPRSVCRVFEQALERPRECCGIEERQPLALALEVLLEMREPIPIGAKSP